MSVEIWDSMYKKSGFTDWETIEPENLKHYIDYISLEKKNFKSILECGCGRGFRMFALILLDNEINSSDVEIKCIDKSKEAIECANAMLAQLKDGKFPQEFLKLSEEKLNDKNILSDEFSELI